MNAPARVAEIARTSGADMPGGLPPNELTMFEVNADGTLTCTVANGEVFIVEAGANVTRDAGCVGLSADQMLVLLLPNVLRHGDLGDVTAGRRFYRTPRIVSGRRIIDYREAGR